MELKSNIACNYILLFISLCLPLHITAQELKENIAIEGHYAPKIIKIDKIYSFPERITTDFEHKSPEFSLKGLPTDLKNEILPMPATVWGRQCNAAAKRGYLDLSAGSWLNSNLSAGYELLKTSGDIAGVALQHNSTSLWTQPGATAKRFRYDERIMAYGSHQNEYIGRFHASLLYHFGYFNYYNIPNTSPTQTLNDISMNMGWHSPSYLRNEPTTPLFTASFALRSFNFRNLALPFISSTNHATPTLQNFKADKENHLSLRSSATIGKDNSKLNVGLDMDFLLYNKSDVYNSDFLATCCPPGTPATTTPQNYGNISLCPQWQLRMENLLLNAGANLDFTIDAPQMSAGSHYSFFHASPQILATWVKNILAASIKISGGTRLNTMASIYDMEYYSLPLMIQQTPSHTPVDITIKFGIGPIAGLNTELFTEFKMENDVPLTGLYPSYIKSASMTHLLFQRQTVDLHGFALGVNINYNPIQWIGVKGSAIWTPQNYNFGIFNGTDRPRFCSHITLTSTPLKNLDLNLQYNIRSDRKFYNFNDAGHLTRISLDNFAALDFQARYTISPLFSLNFKIINLLNRNNEIIPDLSTNGIEFCGGFQLLF